MVLSLNLIGAGLPGEFFDYDKDSESMKTEIKARYNDNDWKEYIDTLYEHDLVGGFINYLDHVGLIEAKRQLDSLKRLKDDLNADKSDVVVFGVGTRGYEGQEIPRYLKRLSIKHPEKKFKIYSISDRDSIKEISSIAVSRKSELYDKDNIADLIESEGSFDRYKLKKYPNVEIVVVAARLLLDKKLIDEKGSFLFLFKKFLLRKLGEGSVVIIQDSFPSPEFLGGIAELFYDFKVKKNLRKANNLQFITTNVGEILVFEPPNKKSQQYVSKTKKYEDLTIWNDPHGDFFLPNKKVKFSSFHPFDADEYRNKDFQKLPNDEKKIRFFDFVVEKLQDGGLEVVGIKGYRTKKPIGWPVKRKNRISILD